jgi:hypothetical protein
VLIIPVQGISSIKDEILVQHKGAKARRFSESVKLHNEKILDEKTQDLGKHFRNIKETKV